MAIQALYVSNDIDAEQKKAIAGFKALGYPTEVGQGMKMVCQHRPELVTITGGRKRISQIRTMPITYKAFCAGASSLIVGISSLYSFVL